VANPKIYIHELIDIRGHHRAEYMHHMTANWGPIGREQRNMLCVGVWGTVGSTERWPQTVNLWELDGWTGLAANFRHEFSHPTLQDPALATWWAEAASYRRGGYDRVLVPAPYSPTLEDAMAAGIRGDVYYHELVTIAPGRAREYLDALEAEWLPAAEGLGMKLLGAYRTAMVNDSEAVTIWAIDTWDTWAVAQAALDGHTARSAVTRWRDHTAGLAFDWRGKLLVDSPLNPLHTGKLL
jgi:hypothetical protein